MNQPKKIGRYLIQRLLGEGAMGSVYMAVDPAIKRTVAIKTIKIDTTRSQEEQDEFLQRFFQEAQISGNLNHPNIVAIYDIGDEEGIPYLALEYVEGHTLNQLIKGSVRPGFETLARSIVQIANALTFAHRKGIVHRDLKPSNIMITPEGEAKIMDFGIAKMSGSNLTQTGIFLGTPSYSSPEQVKEGRVDHRSDIFSLGILAHEVLTGYNPFPGKNISTILYKIANEEPESPPNLNALPVNQDCWHRVFRQVLHKNPEKRCQNASKFGQMLLQCIKLSKETSEELSGIFDEGPATVKRTIGVDKKIERSEFEQEQTKLESISFKKRSRKGLLVLLSLLVVSLGYLGLDYFKLVPEKARLSQFLPKETRMRFFPPAEIQKTIHITSDPEGASIFIDNAPYKKTPADYVFSGLPDSELVIKIQKEGYESFQKKLLIRTQEKVTLRPKLVALPIQAEISSQPIGASVEINGKKSGKTPLAFSFVKGTTYRIVFTLSGHTDKTVQFNAGKDPLEKLNAQLKADKPPGKISIQSAFSDLTVTVNGRKRKRNITLPEGSYKLELSAPSVYYRETKRITVKSGKTQSISTPVAVNIKRIDFNNPSVYGVVFIDGRRVDDTPIINTMVSKGVHHFKFVDESGNILHQEKKEVLVDGSKILAPD
ncbi:MAG: hypothetical protein CSA81_05105 [Acidobacteria bacterium]|nr:MAG: hypothetical protein CSA81_05105 [Acidobacteriota bacterium]PIE91032.1 MAG: hypothetical protein CR997_02630 [Acidobacteriota bacterium]